MSTTAQVACTLRCSMVVTTWKRPALLRATLNSLQNQTYPCCEIIVVCDGEAEEVRAIAQEFAGDATIRWVFHPENRGLPAARNTGAREAGGDVVLFLDDDVIAQPDLVAVHMRHHAAVPGYRQIAVCSQVEEDRATPLESYVDECLHEAWKQTLDGFRTAFSAPESESVGEAIERMVWFGLNCSIRRDVFLQHGGFQENLRASDEEMELGLRLYLAGVEIVFEPSRLLTHKNSKQLTTYFKNAWRASGELDPYRLFQLGQRNAQTQRLTAMYHGYWLDRMGARCAWTLSGPLQSLASRLESVANRTRRRALFGAWARTAQASEYWGAVKASGCTLSLLRQAAPEARCALMLHSVCRPETREEATYYIRPSRFHRLMGWMRLTGRRTASLEEWLSSSGAEGRVLLTFDDAYDDLYEELLPLVIEHGLRAVLYLVANHIGGSNVWDQRSGLRARNLLTLSQIREMQKYGVEFGSHTLTHPFLPEVTDSQLRSEVRDSKARLEDLLGCEISSFAYPHGGVDRRVRSAVAEAGYRVAFTILPGLNRWNDPLCQLRADVNDSTSLLDFACQLRTGYGFAQAIGARLGALEGQLPTHALRSLVRGIRTTGHRMRHPQTPG